MSAGGRIRVVLTPLSDPVAFRDRCLLAPIDEPELTLGALLEQLPALAAEPLDPVVLKVPLSRLRVEIIEPDPERPWYLPPSGAVRAGPATEPSPAPEPRPLSERHPSALSEFGATLIAYDAEIGQAAAYLNSAVSVLVRCDKLLVSHLARDICGRSGLRNQTAEGSVAGTAALLPLGRRADLVNALTVAIRDASLRDVVVLPHLDLLAGQDGGGSATSLLELTEPLYARTDVVLLGFVDPSMTVPEVVANRFAARLTVDVLPREVPSRDGRLPVGLALVTREEAGLFTGFDPIQLYKHVAGMNAVRLRQAMRFAATRHRAGGTMADLIEELRVFKTTTIGSFEIPNVSFDDIGGYEDIKAELQEIFTLLDAPGNLARELVPRGLILHGPPGTGKTLFAKAIATAMNATIQVVSGPEITDKYVGESERKVRDLFADARRSAPAVIVFDEFDSLAGRRSDRDDGGSRAGNAIVAQLLTEMDGFRPEAPVLLIGTTNRLDIIDPALLRPSRFHAIQVGLPDTSARRAIAAVHANRFGIVAVEAVLDALAVATQGMTGDEIRSIFRDALVGERFGNPPRRADAERLGELVGRLRRQRAEGDAARRGTAPRQVIRLNDPTGAPAGEETTDR